MEAFEVWWPPWSSKPVSRITRGVGSIPIRFRHLLPLKETRQVG